MSLPHPRIDIAAPSAHAIWEAYRCTGDERERHRLLFTLAPLVRHAGARTAEEASAGLTALAAAIDAYAPETDGALESFAWAYVRTALGARV